MKMEDRRRSKRIEVFYIDKDNARSIPVEFLTRSDNKINCLVKDISLHGVRILMSKEYDLPDKIVTLHICPNEEIGFKGASYKMQKVWSGVNESLEHRNIGCQFIEDPKELEETVKLFSKKLEEKIIMNIYIKGIVEL